MMPSKPSASWHDPSRYHAGLWQVIPAGAQCSTVEGTHANLWGHAGMQQQHQTASTYTHEVRQGTAHATHQAVSPTTQKGLGISRQNQRCPRTYGSRPGEGHTRHSRHSKTHSQEAAKKLAAHTQGRSTRWPPTQQYGACGPQHHLVTVPHVVAVAITSDHSAQDDMHVSCHMPRHDTTWVCLSITASPSCQQPYRAQHNPASPPLPAPGQPPTPAAHGTCTPAAHAAPATRSAACRC